MRHVACSMRFDARSRSPMPSISDPYVGGVRPLRELQDDNVEVERAGLGEDVAELVDFTVVLRNELQDIRIEPQTRRNRA
jgi:hypothetical protein